MSYFPAFLSMDDKKILIVGGGNIAREKLEHLLCFTKDITLIAINYNDAMKDLIKNNNLKYEEKPFSNSDIEGFDIIIAAIDDMQLQKDIYFETRKYNCLCNCVDLKEYCDFIFPSFIKKGDLTIAISTSGSSPAMAKQLKMWISEKIPDSIEEFLNSMKEYRKTMPKGIERMKFLDNKVKEYIKSWGDKK